MANRNPIITGTVFGRLTVVGRLIGSSRIKHICECSCGQTKIIRADHLISGASKSCGCLIKELMRKKRTTHGQASRQTITPEYRAWRALIQRCENPNVINSARYKGRGITVCDRWRASFTDFYEDMGKRPEGMSIDRINNDGPYSPENCRWATRITQARNKSSNRIITINEESRPVSEWAEIYGLKYETLYRRLTRYGWSPEKAIRKP